MSDEAEKDMSPGTFGWNELASSNIAGSEKFYVELFGWEAVAVPGMDDYKMFKVGDKNVAGFMDKSAMCDGEDLWLSYVNIADVNASLAKAVELGAETVREVTEIPGMGSFAVIKDPQGAMIAFWQSAEEKCC